MTLRPISSATTLLIALALWALPIPASAHFESHTDPQDTEEGFDVQVVRLRTFDGRLSGKVAAYGDGTTHAFHVRVEFDSRGNQRMDYFAFIGWDDGSGGIWEATLYRRGGRVVDFIRARERASTILFHFPLRLLDASKHIRWRVSVESFIGEGGTAVDRAPDSGSYEH